MPGAGTKTVNIRNKPEALCLDLTRLMSRAGRILTGVDRVELAYLDYFLESQTDFYGLIRTSLGYVLLDRQGCETFRHRLIANDWMRSDLLSRIASRRSLDQKKAESTVRKLAIGRARRFDALLQHLPLGIQYWNVGHSNLSKDVFQAVKSISGASINVLVHDMIPLQYPEFQRPGTVQRFEEKMRSVSKWADFVVYNSQDTCNAAESYFADWGRVPDNVVAHLGVELSPPDPTELPNDLDADTPFFMILGTIEPRKNHAFLLDLWSDLATKANLLIIGARGWNNEDVFRRLDEKPPGVIELNNLSDKAISHLLGKTNGLLFPTFAEGYGFPAAEAALAGAPVICNDLPVFREFLDDYPIYAATTDAYAWKSNINMLIHKVKHHQPMMQTTWHQHFERVFGLS